MNDERIVASGDRRQALSVAIGHDPLVFFVLASMEAVLLALICLSPWAYGAVHPNFEFFLDAGIALLLGLWAVRMLLERQITWKNSAVAICLASLFLLGIWQDTPLSPSMLAWLSPGTVRCYDKLLPEQPETLPNAVASSDAVERPGSTLSLYPGATQRESIRLLAVFLVFVVVYNNLTSKEALIRLCWVALINGALLSLFALFQFFAAPPLTVYWVLPSQATPFGPFICHNHFPDYVNMCIGLGIGLLMSQRDRGHSAACVEQDVSPLQMLRNPRALGICGALGLMLTAVVFSRSRGGLLALVGAAILCGVLARLRLGRSFRLGPGLVVAGVAVGLSAWFGIDLIKNRLATLGTGEAYENRVPLWLRSLPIVGDFPACGTGYGTFAYVEPMYRKDAPTNEALVWYDHAHNDYLEILVEGGVVGLGLTMLALIAVFRLGYRALASSRGRPRAGLALGALFAFTALALHSFGEFGMHIPAITLFTTVVCAHLCALGQSKPRKVGSVSKYESPPLASASGVVIHDDDADRNTYRICLRGVAPVLGAIVAMGLGLLICADTWKAYRIDRLKDAAFRAGNAEADQLRTRIACLTEAILLGPEDAELHFELGNAHARLLELLVYGSFPDARAALGQLLAERTNSPEYRAKMEQAMLALREHLRARDACPLLSGTQLGIARFAPLLQQGDKPEDYLLRAKRLIPGRADMWYQCGLQEFTQMPPRFQDAFASWRHCLELSDQYLPEILKQTPQLSTKVLLEKVLPDNPEVLLAAALARYPDFGSVGRRRPFLEKALRLLESKEKGMESQDLLLKARIYRTLEQPDQAIQLYREFLNRDASEVRLRYEFASYLREVGKLEEAQHELTVILAQEPKNDKAKTLLDAVLHDMLQEKSQERARQREDWWLRHKQRK